MTVQDLINAVPENTPLNVDGADAGQCTAIPHKWEQMLGLALVLGNAKDTYDNADPNIYDKELNTPTNIPPDGAIIVWNGNWGNGDGHTAVSQDSTVQTLRVLEQNDPDGTNPHIGTHNYNDVIGWFTPKVLNQGDQDMVENEAQLALLTSAILNRQPQPGDSGYIGQGFWQVVTDFYNSGEHKDLIAAADKGNAAQSSGTVLQPGSYIVQ